jgi:hypothetical protein
MSKKRQGIKEYIGDDPQRMTQYATTLNVIKQQAESAMGVQFGPTGANGHLSAAECGRVGGAMTKSVFLSMADAGAPTIASSMPQAQAPQTHLQ